MQSTGQRPSASSTSIYGVNAHNVFFWAIGAVEGLLLARLVLRLFAARPDNPVVAIVLSVTGFLRAPLAFLDAAQPQFGAVLEFSTLVLLLALPAGAIVWGMLARRGGRWHRGHE